MIVKQASEQAQKQVVVIGAGPGGYVAAIRLAQLGQQVTLVEAESLGGTCLNWGCIPSKALIEAAGLVDKLKHHGPTMGITATDVQVDFPKLMAWKDGVVKKLTQGIGQLLKANGVTTVMGQASFMDAHTLKVAKVDGTTETLGFDAAVIATGSVSAVPPTLPLDDVVVMDSRQALSLSALPKQLVLIGGGVIGLELGLFYHKLGVSVTIVEMAESLLPGVDSDLVGILSRRLKKAKLPVYTQHAANLVGVSDGIATLAVQSLKDPDAAPMTLTADVVLVAVGRKPNTQGLELSAAGLSTTERGFVAVNAQGQTVVPNIYAIGDVAQGPLGGGMLAHRASTEAKMVAEVISGQITCADWRALPAAVFTDPEIGMVGITEQEALAQGLDIKIGRFPMGASGRAMTLHETDGLVKLISDAQTGQLLGAHIIGPHASELIASAALGIELGATAEDLALTIHTHPTLQETIMEAAEDILGHAVHAISKPPRAPIKKALAGVSA